MTQQDMVNWVLENSKSRNDALKGRKVDRNLSFGNLIRYKDNLCFCLNCDFDGWTLLFLDYYLQSYGFTKHVSHEELVGAKFA
jgi:hypothetical protein